MDKVGVFLERIDALLAEHGETDNSASERATGQRDLIRKCRTARRIPSSRKLEQLADWFGVSIDYLTGRTDQRAPASEVSIADVRVPFRPGGPRADLPILGTALGHTLHFDEGGVSVEQMTVDHNDVLRFIQRPPSLSGISQAYAVYIHGDSMYPRYKQGELAVVDPRKPPQIGDDVIVQLLGDPDDNGDTRVVCVLIKELVRKSASWVELRQFNPDTRFRVDAAKVASVHRIVPIGDLLGA